MRKIERGRKSIVDQRSPVHCHPLVIRLVEPTMKTLPVAVDRAGIVEHRRASPQVFPSPDAAIRTKSGSALIRPPGFLKLVQPRLECPMDQV